VTSPGSVSSSLPEGGMPLWVPWGGPPARTSVPSWPGTRVPAVAVAPVATVSGGRAVAHPPVQVDEVGVSPAWTYSVRPLALVRTGPRLVVAMFTTTPVEPPELGGVEAAVEASGADVAAPDEHATAEKPTKTRLARPRQAMRMERADMALSQNVDGAIRHLSWLPGIVGYACGSGSVFRARVRSQRQFAWLLAGREPGARTGETAATNVITSVPQRASLGGPTRGP